MKRSYFFFPVFAALVTTLSAQNTSQVKVSFEHKAGANTMSIDHSVFPIWDNRQVKLTRAEFYVSDIGIRQTDGTETLLANHYLLVDAGDPLVEFDLGSWPVDAADGVTLHLGVPPAVNHLDPTTYPAGHPLAPQNPSMHWGWAAGYRFMAIEGKIDNNGDGTPETLFEFHNVGDELYKTLELAGVETAENGVLHLHFVIDYAELFNNIPMTGTLAFHGNTTMNVAMMNNSAAGEFITMQGISTNHEVALLSQKISASPNPFSTATLIRYDLPVEDGLTMVVTDFMGRVVRTLYQLPAQGSLRLEQENLPAGVYLASFYENKHLVARKQLVVGE